MKRGEFPQKEICERNDYEGRVSDVVLDKYERISYGLDGSGKWITEAVGANTTWTCPKGLYEVYVKTSGNNQSIHLNDVTVPYTSGVTGQILAAGGGSGFPSIFWYPVSGAGSYDFVAAGTHYIMSMASRGWVLSEGETLRSASSFTVRFRRVG